LTAVSEAHPASYTVGTEGVFHRVKAAGADAGHSHLVPRSRMVELYLHSSTVFLAWCLITALPLIFIVRSFTLFVVERQLGKIIILLSYDGAESNVSVCLFLTLQERHWDSDGRQ
jgi:hypothetical protein